MSDGGLLKNLLDEATQLCNKQIVKKAIAGLRS